MIDVERIMRMRWHVQTSYTASEIITYNIALGSDGRDLSLCFEGHPDFHPLPSFGSLPVIRIMGDVTESMAQFLPDFKAHNHVHGEHYLETLAPFPKAGTLNSTARIVDMADRRSGVTVCVGISTSDAATGRQVCYNEWTSFVMRVPGAGLSAKPIPRGARTASHPSPSRPPVAVVEQKTTPEQGALYRAASGDLNPLHIDPAVAKAGGFPAPILTGTCTIGMGVKAVVEACAGGDHGRFRNVKVRLSKPVFPGDVVRTEMWKEDGGRRIVFRMSAGEDGRIAISNAAVELAEVGGPKL